MTENEPQNIPKEEKKVTIAPSTTEDKKDRLPAKALAAPDFNPDKKVKGGPAMIPKLGLQEAGLAPVRSGAKTSRARNAPTMPFKEDIQKEENKKRQPKKDYNPQTQPLTSRGERKNYN